MHEITAFIKNTFTREVLENSPVLKIIPIIRDRLLETNPTKANGNVVFFTAPKAELFAYRMKLDINTPLSDSELLEIGNAMGDVLRMMIEATLANLTHLNLEDVLQAAERMNFSF